MDSKSRDVYVGEGEQVNRFDSREAVANWILVTPFSRLEQRIRDFSRLHQAYALDWARNVFKTMRGDEAQIKLAVAVIGTLAPTELDEAEPLEQK